MVERSHGPRGGHHAHHTVAHVGGQPQVSAIVGASHELGVRGVVPPTDSALVVGRHEASELVDLGEFGASAARDHPDMVVNHDTSIVGQGRCLGDSSRGPVAVSMDLEVGPSQGHRGVAFAAHAQAITDADPTSGGLLVGSSFCEGLSEGRHCESEQHVGAASGNVPQSLGCRIKRDSAESTAI